MLLAESFSPANDTFSDYPHISEQSLLDCFRAYFKIIDADTPDLSLEAHRLRYRIYCVEKGFENSAAFPDELERDEFDSHAAQGLLLDRLTGIAVGTARLV